MHSQRHRDPNEQVIAPSAPRSFHPRSIVPQRRRQPLEPVRPFQLPGDSAGMIDTSSDDAPDKRRRAERGTAGGRSLRKADTSQAEGPAVAIVVASNLERSPTSSRDLRKGTSFHPAGLAGLVPALSDCAVKRSLV